MVLATLSAIAFPSAGSYSSGISIVRDERLVSQIGL
jgi:hypothetical protein